MILQLSGLASIIAGSIIAAEAEWLTPRFDAWPHWTVNRQLVSCKFEFWYQWRNNIILATIWRNLRKEEQKHLSFLTRRQDITGQISPRQIYYPKTTCILLEGVYLGPIARQETSLNRKLLTPATNRKRFVVISTRNLHKYQLHYPGLLDGTERDNWCSGVTEIYM
jgi:hypothetical protein